MVVGDAWIAKGGKCLNLDGKNQQRRKMENYKYKTLAALLLVFKGAPLSNSFKITKFLESIYRTKDSFVVLSEIRKNKYVDFETIKGVDHYTLTFLGKEFITQNFKDGRDYLLGNYPDVTQITIPLFDNYSDLEKSSI